MLNPFSSWLHRSPFLCPFCLTQLPRPAPPYICSHCHMEWPGLYVRDYHKCPLLPIQPVGWTSSGKTAYLEALTLSLMRMSQVWPKFAYSEGTVPTQRIIDQSIELGQGQALRATGPSPQELYMVLLYNMERWGHRTLITRDCAGEVFNTLDVPPAPTPLLRHAPVLMLINLPDLRQDPKARIEALLTNYMNALLLREPSFRPKDHKLVVVFTKADRMERILPRNLWHYVMSDVLWTSLNAAGAKVEMSGRHMQEYLDTMDWVSETIRRWVGSQSWGKPFLCLADAQKLDLRFSVVSSLEDQPSSTNQPVALQPRRVLDPFFWVLELQSRY